MSTCSTSTSSGIQILSTEYKRSTARYNLPYISYMGLTVSIVEAQFPALPFLVASGDFTWLAGVTFSGESERASSVSIPRHATSWTSFVLSLSAFLYPHQSFVQYYYYLSHTSHSSWSIAITTTTTIRLNRNNVVSTSLFFHYDVCRIVHSCGLQRLFFFGFICYLYSRLVTLAALSYSPRHSGLSLRPRISGPRTARQRCTASADWSRFQLTRWWYRS